MSSLRFPFAPAALLLGASLLGCAAPAPTDLEIVRRPTGRPAAPDAAAPEPPDASRTATAPADSPDAPPPPIPGAAGHPALEEWTQERRRRSSEARAVAEHYHDVGMRFYRQLDYREAARNFQIAHEADPSYAPAEQQLVLTQVMMGVRDRTFEPTAARLAEQREVLIQQRQIEVERTLHRGRIHLEAAEHDRAIEHFERVLEQLAWFHLRLEDKDELAAAARRGLDEANARRRDTDLARKEAQRRRAASLADAEVARVRDRDVRKVATLLRRALDQLRNTRLQQAEETLDEVLSIDPDHSMAHRLRADAIRARHVDDAHRLIVEDTEQRTRDAESTLAISVPYSDPIRWADDDRWRISSSRGQGIALAARETPPWIRSYERVLETRKVTLNFPDTPLSDVVDFLQDITGLNITIASAIDGDDLSISLTLRDIRLGDALAIILEQVGLARSFSDGTLLITEPEAAVGDLFFDVLDVQDILASPRDFEGPTVQLAGDGAGGGGASGGSGAGTLVFDDEDDGSESAFGADELLDLIEQSLPDEALDPEGSSIEIHRGQLLLNGTREVHDEVRRLLVELRKNAGLFVLVETKFIVIHDDFLQDFGIDYRGLGLGNPSFGTPLEFVPSPTGHQRGQPGAFADDVGGTRTIPSNPGTRIGPQGVNNPLIGPDNVGFRQQNVFERGAPFLNGMRLNPIAQAGLQQGLSLQTAILEPFQLNAILTAEREMHRDRIVNAPIVVAGDRQRVHTAVVTQRAYIADFELSSGGTGLAIAEVADPIVEVFQEGVVLDVRPTIHHDRKYITLDLRPTLATLVGGDFTQIPVNLGTISMAAINVNIEVPAIQLSEAFTSVTIPDGGSALVGGFRQFDERILRSSTPFLDSIPLVNVLGRREGELRETESLLVLVTARILDVRAEERKRYGR